MDRAEISLKTVIGLKRLSNNLDECVKKEIIKKDININEFAVMELLFHKGRQTIQQIKQRILIADSSTTYVIDRLCAKNLVLREQCNEDKRVFYVNLTKEGSQLIRELFPIHKKEVEDFFAPLSDSELENLHKLLKKSTGYEA